MTTPRAPFQDDGWPAPLAPDPAPARPRVRVIDISDPPLRDPHARAPRPEVAVPNPPVPPVEPLPC